MMNSCYKRRTCTRRAVSLLLSLLLVVGMLPFAASAAVSKSLWGSDTEGNLKYDYYSDGTAIITGTTSRVLTEAVIPAKIGDKMFRTVGIGKNAFLFCRKLTKVTLPNTLQSIGDSAFSGSAVQNITIPGSVLDIGSKAFFNCTSLKEVTILYGVKSIGNGAFAGCASLTRLTLAPCADTIMDTATFGDSATTNTTVITVPGSVPSLSGIGNVTVNGNLPDDSPASYKYIVDPDTGEATVEGYFGSSTTPIIPDTINGSPVTKLGDTSFKNRRVTKVTLPSSLVTIGTDVFTGTGLEYIEIPDSVTGIGDNAFDDDANLTIKGSCSALDEYLKHTNKIKFIPYGPGAELYHELTMKTSPVNAGTIVKGAISRDYRTGLVIPIQAKPEQGYLFKGWTTSPDVNSNLEDERMSATNFTMPGNNVTLTATFEKVPPEPLIIRDGDVRAYFGGGPQVVIPREYGKNGQEDLTNKVPVVSIGAQPYYNGSGHSNSRYVFKDGYVEELDIPDTIQSIYGGAFYQAYGMQKIVVAANNTRFSSADGILFNKDKTELIYYPANRAGESYTVPPTVTKIGEYAFSNNKNLKTIDLNNVTYVDTNAFREAEALTDIIMPKVTNIGSDAFYSCRKLSSVAMPQVSSIGSSAFSSCTKLNNVAFPASLKSMESHAFESCSALDTITWAEECQLTSIPYYGFSGCAFSEINVPKAVTSLSSYSFGNNSKLTTVHLPASMTSFASDTLVGSANVISITVDAESKNYSSADDILFNRNKTTLVAYPPAKRGVQITRTDETTKEDSTIEVYTVPDSVTTLADGAFAYSRMGTVKMPNVTHIGSRTFWNAAITSIDLAKITKLDSSAFEDCNGLTEVTLSKVEEIASGLFQSCTNLTTVHVPEGVTKVNDSAFYNCGKLTAITLPKGVTSIGSWAFFNCQKLETLVLPSTLKTIGSEAFYDCYALKEAVIPAGVTDIGTYAYEYCTGMTSLTFAERPAENASPLNIGYRAFQYCAGLETVALPTAVTTLGESAFLNCTELKSAVVGAETIGNNAFTGCTSLKALTLSEHVKSIGSYAFANCGITTVQLPKTLTSFGLHVFQSNPLKEITVAEGSESFLATDGVLISKDGTLLLYPSAKTVEETTPAPDDTTPAGPVQPEEEAVSNEDGTQTTENTVEKADTQTPVYEQAAAPGESEDAEQTAGISQPDDSMRVMEAAQQDGGKQPVDAPKAGPGKTAKEREDERALQAALTAVNPAAEDAANPTVLGKYTVPAHVTAVRSYAFENANGLSAIEFGENVATLQHSLFDGCQNLRTVTVRNKTAAFENQGNYPYEYVFYGAANIDKIMVEGYSGSTTEKEVFKHSAQKLHFRSIDNAGTAGLVIDVSGIEKDRVTPYATVVGYNGHEKEIVIPSAVDKNSTGFTFVNSKGEAVELPDGKLIAVTTIGANALLGDESDTGLEQIESVKIPLSVKTIKAGAFTACTGLTSEGIQLPESIETIEYAAFNGCTGLTTMTIPANVKVFGADGVPDEETDTKVYTSVFDGCTSLTEILVAEGNNSYASMDGVLVNKDKNKIYEVPYAFTGDNGTYVIPEGIISIAASAFEGSTLTRIETPSTLEVIGLGAFKGAFTSGTGVTVVLNEGLVEIKNEAFKNCTGLASISIPSSVERIGDFVFDGCTGLVNITVAANNKGNYVDEEGVLYAQKASKEYTGLTSHLLRYPPAKAVGTVTLDAKNLVEIYQGAMADCSEMESIVMPNTVSLIGEAAFRSCSKLESVTFPDSVSFIGPNAFAGDNLMEINLPEGLENIGSYAFANNPRLLDVKLPGTLKEIGEYAFLNTAMSSVTIPASVKTIGKGAFTVSDDFEYTLATVIFQGADTQIANGAFEDRPELTFTAAENSTAHTYQKKHSKINFIAANTILAEDPAVPDETVPDTSVPDTNVPDTDVPDTNEPDTNEPDTNVPDTSVPDTNEPDTNVPDTDVPDTNEPDTNVPDTDVPDTNVPDTDVPDTDVPDTNVPDTDVPDTNEPDTNVPDTDVSDTGESDSTVPDTDTSISDTEQEEQNDGGSSDQSAPETETPDDTATVDNAE